MLKIKDTINGNILGTVNGFSIQKSVPSNAVFTDTNTWRPVVNNLTSTATDQSLSAAQGKALKGLIDGKAASSHAHQASQVTFTDGKTFQQKLDDGSLRGPQGIQGAKGATGATGATPTIKAGTVTTGNAGTNASVTASTSGTTTTFNFTIPRGATGAKGATGATGAKGADGLTTSITVNGTKYTHSSGNITLPSYPTLSSLGAAAASHEHTMYLKKERDGYVAGTTFFNDINVSGSISAGNNIKINESGYNFIAPNNYGYMGEDTNGTARYLLYMNGYDQVNVGYDNRLIKFDCTNPIQREGHKIYHEGYKPTASQIGALPKNDPVSTGTFDCNGDMVVSGILYPDKGIHCGSNINCGADIDLAGSIRCAEGITLNWIDDTTGTAYWICLDSANGGNSQITFRPDTDNKGNLGHANWTWNYANITTVSNRSAIRPEDAYEVSLINNNDEMYNMVKDMNFYMYKEVSIKEYEEVETLKASEEYINASEKEQKIMLKNLSKSTPSAYDYSKKCRISTNAEELPFEVAPLNEKSNGNREIDVVAFTTGLASALQKAIYKIEELEKEVEELKNGKGE